MKIEVLNEDRKQIQITNDKNQMFMIHYGGADLFWTMFNYQENNEFIITNDQHQFFDSLGNLFQEIEEYDNEKLLNNNVFIWIGESDKPDVCSKLQIKKNEDSFVINFIRNPLDFASQFCNRCIINFCLCGSRNQQIAYAFSSMLINYKENQKVKTNMKDSTQ